MMRSKLFVPASRPELFAKALASEADAISIDLEDAVVEDRKADARSAVRDFLRSDAARTTRKTLIVRINAIDTPHFLADLAAVVQTSLSMLNLPKPESSNDVLVAVDALERAESANGVGTPVAILANIETAKALRCANDIAAAHPRVAGLQLGYADMFEPLAIDRYNAANVHAAMFALRLAAGEADVFAIDGAYPHIADAAGFRVEAEMARHLGYRGKSCIHPSQIAIANEVFSPSNAEIDHAQKVIDGARHAESNGIGAIVVAGKMIDAPFVRRAEAILAMAHKLKLPNNGSRTPK